MPDLDFFAPSTSLFEGYIANMNSNDSSKNYSNAGTTRTTAGGADVGESAISETGGSLLRRPRKNTTIDSAIHHPGNVVINVAGAFIVEDEPGSPPRIGNNNGGTRDIRLPHHSAEISHIAVDIGGSLAKVVYFTPDPDGEGGRLNFTSFETDNIDQCIEYMGILINHQKQTNRVRRNEICLMATGGGAYKYYDKIKEALGVEIYREDEMECLIVGLDFFITEIPEEVFTYSEQDPMRFAEPRADLYPYLLVNIGSGVSMVKVSGPQQFERIGGSSLGGGTLWGLLSLLTGARSFDEMLHMADNGDNTAVDMLVGDIYGADYGRIGLKATTIASSFGKVFKKNEALAKKREEALKNGVSDGDLSNQQPMAHGPENIKNFRAEDISRSLLYAVSNNIGQIAYLQAQKHNLEHIYFGGSFIRGHRQTMNTLSYAIKFWSKGEKQAYFLRHEGYLGSVGAFMRRQETEFKFRRNSLERRSFSADIPMTAKGIFGDRQDRRGSVF